jgi:hypothetical protein
MLAGQRHLEDAFGHLRDLRLAVEAEQSRPGIEDAVAVGRKARQELLRALEPKAPVDDRKAKDVEPRRGRKKDVALGSGSAQRPYLATAGADASARPGHQQLHFFDLDGRLSVALLDEVVHPLPDRLHLRRRIVGNVVVATPGQDLAVGKRGRRARGPAGRLKRATAD